MRLAKDAAAPAWDAFTGSHGWASGADNLRLCVSQTWRAMTWDVLPAGRYRLVARCRAQSGGRGYLAQARISNLPCAPVTTVTDIGYWHLYSLGDYASDGRTALRIVGKSRESAHGLLVDWLMAVPLDHGTPTTFVCAAPSIDSVTLGWLEATMQASAGWGTTLAARRYVSGSGLKVLGAARLLVMAGEVDEHLPRPPVTVQATWTPRFTHWVPTPEV